MILACSDCDRSWRYPCDDCAEGFIDQHRAETGHEITVQPRDKTHTTAYRYQQTQPAWPAWMRRGTA